MKKNIIGWLSASLLSGFFAHSAFADEYASTERSQAALGHYARARAMLVEALAEFEEGRRIARPDMVLDSEEWRLSIVSRTEELNRVLDPQPKITKSGVRFKAVGRMIRRESERLPVVADGARDANTYGEDQRAAELEAARLEPVISEGESSLKTPAEQAESSSVTSSKATETTPTSAEDVKVNSTISRYDQEIQKLLDTQESTTVAPAQPAAPTLAPAVETKKEDSADVVKQATPEEENSELSDAIEQAIRKRLREAETSGTPPTENLE